MGLDLLKMVRLREEAVTQMEEKRNGATNIWKNVVG
jgi:hypothetical protein